MAVVIGRDTPAIKNDNDQIARLVARHPQMTGVGFRDEVREKVFFSNATKVLNL